jgi:hypothetical protein
MGNNCLFNALLNYLFEIRDPRLSVAMETVLPSQVT